LSTAFLTSTMLGSQTVSNDGMGFPNVFFAGATILP
jgi:hypothetical protein